MQFGAEFGAYAAPTHRSFSVLADRGIERLTGTVVYAKEEPCQRLIFSNRENPPYRPSILMSLA